MGVRSPFFKSLASVKVKNDWRASQCSGRLSCRAPGHWQEAFSHNVNILPPKVVTMQEEVIVVMGKMRPFGFLY